MMDYSSLKLPNHVGIIVDGNGRWALERGLSRSKGHEAGFNNVKKLGRYIFSKGINYVSAYLFSTENFKRSEMEVNFLMNLFATRMEEILEFCHEDKIKIVVSGRKERLSSKIIKVMERLEEETKNYDKVFNLCFNYGSHAEIIDATKKIVNDVNDGKLDIDNLDESIYSKYLYQDLPPIDFLIRTSGEMRLSNFMLWQVSYAEFYFPKVYFPDFDENEFDKAIVEYTSRDRRFGGINYENKSN